MKQRRRLFLVIMVMALGIFFGCSKLTFELTIPKASIEAQIQKTFPTVRSQGLMTVKLDQPKLEFLGKENRLRVIAQTEVRFFGLLPVLGSASATGTLSYQAPDGSFHFTDVKVEKFDLQGINDSRLEAVTAEVGTLLLSSLGGLEVYRLDPNDTKENVAKLVLKGIQVKDTGIVVTVGL